MLVAKDDVGSVRPIEDGRAGPEIALDDDAYAIAGSGANLWVTTEGGLAQVDTAARKVVGGPVDLEAGSGAGVAVGEGALWVTDTIDGTVIRADPVTARPVGDPIPVSSNLRGPIVAGEGAVWVLARGRVGGGDDGHADRPGHEPRRAADPRSARTGRPTGWRSARAASG